MKRRAVMILLAGIVICAGFPQSALASQISVEPYDIQMEQGNIEEAAGPDESLDTDVNVDESENGEIPDNMVEEPGNDLENDVPDEEEPADQPLQDESDIQQGEANDSAQDETDESENAADQEENESDEIEEVSDTEEQAVLYSNVPPFTYNTIYTKPVVDQIGGVNYSDIHAQAKALINKYEGDYTSVNKNDNGALSIGFIQWHGNNALRLLKEIISRDNVGAYEILGESLYTEITGADTVQGWTARILNDDEANKISSLLGTEAGRKAQDEEADSYINIYINRGYNLGIKNAAALVYYADVANQSGVGGAETCGRYANRLVKDWNKVTLNELHIATVCYAYSAKPGTYLSNPANRNTYISRRRAVYGVASGLGWTYCNSGDYRIPYNTTWSSGAAWLQKALNTYQNAGLTVDGSYGAATQAAVKKFQQSVGLTADGYAGLETSSMLIYKLYYDMAVNGAANPGTAAPANPTDIIYDSQTKQWRYCVNGVFDSSYTGVASNKNGWWYVKNGVVDFSYYGFAQNENGWWYLEGGQVTFTKNDVIKGSVSGETAWWYVKGSKVTFTETVARNSNGWWYVNNGKVDFSYSGVAKNENGWWRIENGEVNFGFNGFAQNSNGWWYLENGQVSFAKNDVIKGSVNGETAWWYVEGSKVTFTDTVAKNSNGWWYIENGKVNFSYNGFAQNSNGWWYIENGRVTFAKNDVIKGDVNGETAWWYVKGSKVTFTNTVAKNSNGWWRIENGKVDFNYTGIAQNENGWWRIENGKVNFNYNGWVTVASGKYWVTNGKVDR